MNELTAWIDASMVYGSDPARAAALRANDGTGRLRESPGGFLPANTGGLDNAPTPFDPSFGVAGDIRANETVPLLAIHTLFLREHNRLAGLLKTRFPAATDEELYQGARRIVWAEIQAITYQEFLPILLGRGGLAPYAGYDPDRAVGIENAFANAALRLGHTLLSPRLQRLDANGVQLAQGPLSLRDSFFAPARLTDGGGIEPLLRGAARQLSQELDAHVTDGVRNFLFGGGLDLPALNVQRGRDHGLPGYNAARRQLGLPARASLAEISSDPALQARLASVYASVEDVDLWTGGLCEDHVAGAQVGEVFFTLLRRQFELLRDGDRFFYERAFSGAALEALRRTRLSDVIRRNTTIGPELSDDAFVGALLPFSENDLTIRAVTASGATASGFAGFVLVTTSDGRAPLDQLVLELAPADQGQLVVPNLALFQALGSVVVTVVSLEPPPELSGSTTVEVVLQDPVIHPLPPAVLAQDGALTLQGLSFPGQLVELVVDGELVATAIAGPGGQYTLSARLAPGTHQVEVRGTDPATGQPVSSNAATVTAPEIPVVALTLTPAQAAVAVGQAQVYQVTKRLADGSTVDATAEATLAATPANVAEVQGPGVVRGLLPGSATVTATLGALQASAQLAVGVPVLVESSPVMNEPSVAVTRETILRFSAPLEAASVTSQAIHADFGGQGLAGVLHVSPDRKTVTLFYAQHLPASSRVRVTVDGGLLRDALGNQIDADRDGVPGGVARIDFDTLSLTAGPPGTVVCGRVFASELAPVGTGSVNVPLEGVKIAVEGAEDTFFVFTDAMGDFRMEPAPAGKFFVLVDGRTATNGVPLNAYYPAVGKQWESKAGEEVNVGTTYLPLVQPGTLQPVSRTEDTTLTFTDDVLRDFPQLRGTQIVVPADSLYADNGARGGSVGIAPVPPDRLPGQLPGDLPFPLVITVQTSGPANFDVPIPVRFPNLTGLPPGATAGLWSFNHDTGAWEVVGGMHVTADGMFVETDPGVGILAPGWHSWLAGILAAGANPLDPVFDLLKKLFPQLFGDQEKTVDDGDCVGTCKWPDCGSVLLHSGEERMERVDLVIPGRGMDFVFRRTYRSQVAYDGVLGFGWGFDFDERLRLEPNGDVTRMNGRLHLDRWVREANGTFTAPRGFFSALRQREDGVYVLRERDGLQRLYSPQGFLFCWVDRFGNQLGFERDEQGDLDFVIDTYGRQIDFAYTTVAGTRRLTRIRDWIGREVLYAYSQEGDLIEVRSPVVMGTSNGNDFPAGRTERYGYSVGFANPQLNHNLLTVTAPEEVATGGPPRLTIVYGTDENDPMTFDKVVARTEGGVNASGVPRWGDHDLRVRRPEPGGAAG